MRQGAQPDLFTPLEAQTWLAQRLQEHQCDIYAGGPYGSFAERLAAAIIRDSLQSVVVGRNPQGKPENYAQLFERIFQQPLLPKAQRPKPTQR